MKRLFLGFGLAVLIAACGPTKAPETTTTTTPVAKAEPTVFANTITQDELTTKLTIYASDEFEGRATGTPGQKKAVEYLKQHYVNLGIPSPLGKDDYFQEVPLEILKAPEVDLKVNGKSFAHYDDFVSVAGGNTQLINAKEVVYVGYGIETEGYNDYKGLDVKGKIVVAKAGEPKNNEGTYIVSGTTDPSKWSNGRQALASKREAAMNNGAKALFLMDIPSFNTYASYFKNQAASGGSNRLSLKENKESMYMFLINEALGKTLVDNIDITETPKMVTTNLSMNFTSVTEDMISENVIAYIKGTEKPNEYIVLSSHLDHVGIIDGEIYNGADDDGSGSVAMLEIAEAFKAAADRGQGPKRSIVFLHVTGEERGLLGSKYYTDMDPVFPLEQTVANLNIDMIGRIDPKRESTNRNYIYLIGSDKLSTELHNISEEVNKKYTNIELDYTYNDENDPNRFYYRSDHYNFAKNNIPIIFYFNGTHADYHKATDTVDKIEFDLLTNRTKLVFYTAWELANRPDRIVADKAEKQ